MSISAQDNRSVTSGYDPVLDEVIEEMANRLQAGEPVDGAAILAKYPDRADSIRRLLPAMEVMAEFGVSASRLAAAGVSPGLSPLTGELGTLGDFRILREVGRGGMGIVYEAEQLSLGRRVALKVLPFAGAMDSQQLRRFRTEAQAAAQLHHTNIVPVYWIGCENGVHYYAMQFIEGRTLADVIRELRQLEGKDRRDGTDEKGEAPADLAASALASALSREFPSPSAREDVPPPAAALGPSVPSDGRAPAPPSGSSTRNRAYFRNVARLGMEAAEALEHAHQEGIVHRDIKPANLMVDAQGHLWVTDFGLARLQNDSGLTITGDLLGTLRYMSPEQALGKRAYLDHRTDIYSLGVTLYELLTLEPAFESTDRAQLLRRIADEDPGAPRSVDDSIPRELETIVLKTMVKEPAGRYQSAQDLADDLRRFLEYKPIRAKRPSPVERLAKWSRRHRGLVTALAVILILTVAGLAIGTVLIEQQRRKALRNLEFASEQKSLADARSRDLEAAYESQERQLYINRVNRAHGEWRESNIALARQLLDACPPNRRGWEWSYCDRLCHLERLTLSGHGLPIHSMAYNPGGGWIITASSELRHVGDRRGEWSIWNTATGDLIGTWQAPGARSVAVDPTGSRIAVGTDAVPGTREGGTVTVWKVTERPIRPVGEPVILQTSYGTVTGLAFSPDGRKLAATSMASVSGSLKLWDLSTGRSPRPLNSSKRNPFSVAFRRDGKQLVVSWSDGTTRLYDSETLEEVGVLSGHDGTVFAAAYSPDGRRIVTGGQDQTVRLWDNSDAPGERGDYLGRHDSFVRSVAFGAEGTRVASASQDNTIRVWNAATGNDQELCVLRGHSRYVTSVAFSPVGRELASASEDATVKIWDLAEAEAVRTISHKHWVPSVAFLRDGSTLASACWDGSIRLWNASEGSPVRTLAGDPPRIMSMAVSSVRNAIAGSSERGTIQLWDADTGGHIRALTGHQGFCFGIAFSPDGRKLASTGRDGTLRLWDVDSGESTVIATAPLKCFTIAVVYSPDGGQVAASFTDGTVRLFPADGGRELLKLDCPCHDDSASTLSGMLAYRPDGRWIAACGNPGNRVPGEVRVFDTTTGREVLQPLRGHDSTVTAVAFSPDGRRIATASYDRTVKLWDAETGQEVFTLRDHAAGVLCVAFSPDGRDLVSGGIKDGVKIWKTALPREQPRR